MAESRIDNSNPLRLLRTVLSLTAPFPVSLPQMLFSTFRSFLRMSRRWVAGAGYDRLRWSGRISNTFQMFSKSFHPGSYCPNGEFPDEGRGAHCAKRRMCEDLWWWQPLFFLNPGAISPLWCQERKQWNKQQESRQWECAQHKKGHRQHTGLGRKSNIGTSLLSPSTF